ncbi:hypothetical protein HYDPIDRAFT_28311, partial [Hydnomerulius pinastri MD-312]
RIAAYDHDSVFALAYSPSGRSIATTCRGKVYLWDAPGDPQPTSQKSPALSPLGLPAVAPQGDHSQGSEYEYTDLFNLSATARPPDCSITHIQPSSSTPRRPLSRFKHTITRQLRRGSTAGGEETGRGPSWWKRTRLHANIQTPPVGDDRSPQRNDHPASSQAPNEPENEGAGRRQMPQQDLIAEGRDRRIFAWVPGPFPDEIKHGCFYHLASYICYGRRDPDLPIAEESVRPNPSEVSGHSRVVDVFHRVLLFLHLRNSQPSDAIPLQPLTIAPVVPSASIPPQSLSPNNVASIGSHGPAAARPAPPIVVVSPPVNTSTALPPLSSSDQAAMSSPAYPVTQPLSSPTPVAPTSSGFSSASSVLDMRPSSSPNADFSSLTPDEASILREYRRSQGRFTVAPAAPSEPHDSESIISQHHSVSSFQTLGPTIHRSPSSKSTSSPRHLSLLDSLLRVQDTSSSPQPFSLSSGQPSSSSIALITDTDPVDAASPLSPSPAEPNPEPDAQLPMLPPSDLCAGSRTDIEADSVPILEFENPWASD